MPGLHHSRYAGTAVVLGRPQPSRHNAAVLRAFTSLLLLTLVATPELARAADDDWLRVALDGRKIGHLHVLRQPVGEEVHTTQTLQLEVDRDGTRIALTSIERARESSDGQPLSFSAEVSLGGSRSLTRGERDRSGLWQVETEQGGRRQRERFEWPLGALLPEGQRLQEASMVRDPGTRYSLVAFDMASLQPLRIDAAIAERETIVLPGGAARALRIEQTLTVGDAALSSTSWIDAEGQLLRTRLQMLGLSMELEACDHACATAPNQSADILALTSLPSPRALDRADRMHPLDYRLRGTDALAPALAAIPGQSVVADETGRWRLRIDPYGAPSPQPDASASAPNRWLQSDAEAIREAALAATADARGDAERMRRLEAFVRRHIEVKSLRLGYASALDVLEGREGDCTEHAVLLAALARSIGIPARVASGVAYAQAFGSQSQAFVPHAWVMAYVEGRWIGFDAALDRFDSGHIAFDLGDGEPFRFYRGIEAMSGLELIEVAVPGRSS